MASNILPIFQTILDEIGAQVAKNPTLPWASNGGRSKPSIQFLVIEAVASTGVKTETVRSRIKTIRHDYPAEFEKATAGLVAPEPSEAPPAAEKPERTLDDDLALSRAKASASHDRSRLEESKARIIALEDKVADYEALAKRGSRPAEWTVRSEAPSQWLVFHHPEYGPVAWHKVWLEKPSSVALAQEEWVKEA